MAEHDSLDQFLAGVERRAYRMAYVSTGDVDGALDIVQNAMLKLVSRYRHKPAADWPPLFYRILNNAITDWHRQRQRGWKVFDRWFGGAADTDPLAELPAPAITQPEQEAGMDEQMQRLEVGLRRLPERQRQAFMLRCWEGLSVKATAAAMGCTAGTVKTLYSRALQNLREQLT
ncbi:MAG: RNA polymerase sigma factor [Gammaproteobacteria bacterium]|nr:RNA polymerase sigma factor [Gammaproteobacteria bacterium]